MTRPVLESHATALNVIREQLREATLAEKCHPCGCLHQTLAALAETAPGKSELADSIADARARLAPKRYDCLGCTVCYPAIAANAFAEAFPALGEGLDLCPTEPPIERPEWPPLPGDYKVVQQDAPVAVCTLNSDDLSLSLIHI